MQSQIACTHWNIRDIFINISTQCLTSVMTGCSTLRLDIHQSKSIPHLQFLGKVTITLGANDSHNSITNFSHAYFWTCQSNQWKCLFISYTRNKYIHVHIIFYIVYVARCKLAIDGRLPFTHCTNKNTVDEGGWVALHRALHNRYHT